MFLPKCCARKRAQSSCAPPGVFPTTNLIALPLKNSSEAAYVRLLRRVKPSSKNKQKTFLFINTPFVAVTGILSKTPISAPNKFVLF